MEAAFGIAASMAAGLRCNAGYSTKPLHAGFAARGGIEAALLARAGISANPRALETEGGIFALYGASHVDRAAEVIKQLGNPFEAIDPGLSPKLYPCCSDIHCAIDAVLDVKAELGFPASDITAVRCFVGTMAEPNVRRRDPATPAEAKFSMSYCVACAIVLGRVGLAQFTADALAVEAVQSMAARITTCIDPLLTEGGESFSTPAAVEIDLHDGKCLRRVLREMRGQPQRPLSSEDLRDKFFDCAERALAEPTAAELYTAVCNIEKLPDILGLMELAGGGHA
jgi:2-methylcitrate dehydratase PrpD